MSENPPQILGFNNPKTARIMHLKGPCHVGKTFDMLKQHVSVFQIYIFYFEIPPGTPLKLEKTANFSVEK